MELWKTFKMTVIKPESINDPHTHLNDSTTACENENPAFYVIQIQKMQIILKPWLRILIVHTSDAFHYSRLLYASVIFEQLAEYKPYIVIDTSPQISWYYGNIILYPFSLPPIYYQCNSWLRNIFIGFPYTYLSYLLLVLVCVMLPRRRSV